MPDKSVFFNSRGVGNNWLPCFICGHKSSTAQSDLAGYVTAADVVVFGTDTVTHPIQGLAHDARVLVTLDYRPKEQGRVQAKFGACGEHKPNLLLLEWIMSNTTDLTVERLERCIPGRKNP